MMLMARQLRRRRPYVSDGPSSSSSRITDQPLASSKPNQTMDECVGACVVGAVRDSLRSAIISSEYLAAAARY